MSVNIYQVFTRLFRNDNGQNIQNGDITNNHSSKFNHFDKRALQAIKKMGISHIWFTGIIRHASTTQYNKFALKADNQAIVKGKAGSPYAIKDYFDVNPDLAENISKRMSEFEALINRCHTEGLKTIIDFVPNHVSRKYESLQKPKNIPNLGENDDTTQAFSNQNNFYYIPNKSLKLPSQTEEAASYCEIPAKATGNNVFSDEPTINDWYETIKLNYGVDYINNGQKYVNPIPSTWHRMLEILQFWAAKGVDGFRVDMAEMIPLEFWHWVIQKIKNQYPHIKFIAEIYQPNLYHQFIFEGGFDWLYDKEQFYNTLRNITEGKAPVSQISEIWKAQEGIEQNMLRFMENHDEQRIASSFFVGNPNKAWPSMVLAATMQTGPLMIYFGQELGETGMDEEGFSKEDGRTTIFDYWKIKKYQKWVNCGAFNCENLNEHEHQIRSKYVELLLLRLHYRVIREGNFYDLMWVNKHLYPNYIYTYLRHIDQEFIWVILNFSANNISNINIQIPYHASNHIGLNTQKPVSSKPILGNCQNYSISKNELNQIYINISLNSYEAAVIQLLTNFQ